MPSIALLAQKGGAGKTTLAVHLAVIAGLGTLLVDLDPQRSAAGWWESRDADYPELAVGEAGDLARALVALPPSAWAIVDTPPHAAPAAETVARQVDFILIPTRPAILDLRAIARTVEFVRRAGSPAAILLNAVPPGRGVAESSVTTEARRALAAYGLPVVPTAVGQRAALAHALNDGRAVTEFEPDGKAAEELRGLWRWCHAEASAHAARRDRADTGDGAGARRTGRQQART